MRSLKLISLAATATAQDWLVDITFNSTMIDGDSDAITQAGQQLCKSSYSFHISHGLIQLVKRVGTFSQQTSSQKTGSVTQSLIGKRPAEAINYVLISVPNYLTQQTSSRLTT